MYGLIGKITAVEGQRDALINILLDATVLVFLAVASGIVFSGCELIDLGDDEKATMYRYTAYDSTGTAIVDGELRVRYIENGSDTRFPIHVEGHWKLRRVSDGAENIGPQTGTGRLQGTVDVDDALWINLNPNWEDNNVMLQGTFTGERFGDIEGEWTYSTFAGGVNGGRFEATR